MWPWEGLIAMPIWTGVETCYPFRFSRGHSGVFYDVGRSKGKPPLNGIELLKLPRSDGRGFVERKLPSI